jgi:hypothetical protein
MSRTPIRRVSLCLALALTTSWAAGAATYVVTLKSGATFETRYKPKQASWDSNKVLVYSDVGNWVSLSRADIDSVRNTLQNKGFGHVLNTTTVELGSAPNDAMTPEALATAMRDNPAAFLGQSPAAPYTVNQFVEPSATQGIPIYGGMNLMNSNYPLSPGPGPGLVSQGPGLTYGSPPVSGEPATRP